MSIAPTVPPRPELPVERGRGAPAGPAPQPIVSGGRWLRLLVLALVWIAAGAYVYHRAPLGWIPYDEGTLSQSAERVLLGQLPHLGYDEPYTGGTSVLHAAAFRLLGPSIYTLRLVLVGCFLAWVPAVWYIATRLASPSVAGVVTLVAAAWSVPTYMSAMPSWYNTIFATFALAAVFAYLEHDRRRWLVAAGCCAGLSILAKISGLYLVAAVLLVLARREQALAQSRPSGAAGRPAYPALLAAGLAGFGACVLLLLRSRLGASEVFHFIAPTAALATYLLAEERRAPTQVATARRVQALLALVAPFLAGVLIPIALFCVPYVRAGALDVAVRGVFVLPLRVSSLASWPLPPLFTIVATLPVLLLVRPVRSGGQAPRAAAVALAAVLLLAVATASRLEVFYAVIASVRAAVPVAALAAVRSLLKERDAYGPRRREQIYAVACVAVLCSYIQFPFAGLGYFFYVAPFVPLLALAVLGGRPARVPGAPAMLGLFYAAFCVGVIVPREERHGRPDPVDTPLALRRAGIVVPRADQRTYAALIGEIRRRVPAGAYVFAEPECPEVNFLSETLSPTRNVNSDLGDPTTRTARTLAAMRARDVRVAVINAQPAHFGPLPPELVAALRLEYPYRVIVGAFEVRWRD